MDEKIAKSLRTLLKKISKNGIAFNDGFSLDDWNTLQVASHPRPELTAALKQTLRSIEPAGDSALKCWPCMALRSSGEWQDYVYLVRAADWFPHWGVWPVEDTGKRELLLEDVRDIRESAARLPARFANELYRQGESGMGYTLFEVEFTDGSRVAYENGNAIDFIAYPPGKSANDIRAIHAHAGRESPRPYPPPEYTWCLFSGPID